MHNYNRIGLDDCYMDACCYNLQQAIELALKCKGCKSWLSLQQPGQPLKGWIHNSRQYGIMPITI